MIHIVHNGSKLVKATKESEEIIIPVIDDIVAQFTKVASLYPEENIIWLKEGVVKDVVLDDLISKFKASNYMLSLGNIKNHFLYPTIGYVTDGPFIAVSQKNIYPTWLMQDTAGIVAASTVNHFKASDYKNQSLEYFLTSIARICQPQGLFCYHVPVNFKVSKSPSISNRSLFKFVSQHYKKVWIFLLLFLLYRYEKTFPFFAFAKALPANKIGATIEILNQQRVRKSGASHSLDYDVVIPTMGRSTYLKNVLLDLNNQRIVPNTVIIIEQNADRLATSELDFIKDEQWNFKIQHEFTHVTGACRARNRAISLSTAKWVLLFDDDVRIDENFSHHIFSFLKDEGVKCLTFSCLQKGETEKYKKSFQWPAFGSGCSIVHREVIEKCKFDLALEHGYGEDVDYGMQIRNAGYDVIYAPHIKMLHIKAPVGGFRRPHVFPWQEDDILPKPSPQIMYHRKKNYTVKQLLGYKLILYIKFYKDNSIKNPISYYKYFKRAWSKSMYWSQKLAEDAKI